MQCDSVGYEPKLQTAIGTFKSYTRFAHIKHVRPQNPHMDFLRKLLGRPLLPGAMNEADGFVDIELPIVASSRPTGGHDFKCRGKVGDGAISFLVHLDTEWNEQPLGDSGSTVHWGTGSIISAGAESDNLVSLLAITYGHNSYSDRRMLPCITAQIVCLSGNPELLPNQDLRMKFFFHPDGEEGRYAEVFVNIENANSVVQFHEKDNEYRLPILRALSEA